MNCNNKIKHTCSEISYATCTRYETELPEFSEIEGCPTIEETTAETYELIGDIREQIDLSALGESCLTYILDENDKIVVKNVLLKYEEEICSLKEQIETLQTTSICNTPISDCNFNFGDLVDSCGNVPTTLGATIQLILDQLNTP